MSKPLVAAGLFSLLLAALLGSSLTRSNDLALLWIKNQSVRETTCDQVRLEPKSDLVFLAETTHGSENIRALNTCLIKHLILKRGFTRVILEWDFTDVVQLNLYIQGDARISRDAALVALKSSLYNSRSMMELFDWMRSQNRLGKKLSVYGTDNWNVQGLIAGVLAYSAGTPLEGCIERNSARVASVYTACRALFKRSSDERIEFGKQAFYLHLLSQILEQYYGNKTFEAQQTVRDRYMYQLFTDIVAQDPTQRSVISMHAQHALPYATKFGSYLAKDGLTKEIYLMSFCAGKVSSFDTIYVNRKLVTLTLPAPQAKTIEAVVCQRRIPDPKTAYDIRDLTSSNNGDNTSTPPALNLAGVFAISSSRSLEFALR